MGKIDDAVKWAKDIANDDSHGYSSSNRWGPEYDCSSFIISAWVAAGVDVKSNGANSTSDMCDAFLKTGFTDVTSKVNVTDGTGLVAGDVLWRSGHTAMHVGNKQMVSASGNKDGGQAGDKTGTEIAVKSYANDNWKKVLRYTA